MIYVHTANSSELLLKESEILRYAGYGTHVPDETELGRIQKIADEVLLSVAPRACCRILPVAVTPGMVDFGVFRAASGQLSKNLAGCKRVLLFSATVGAQVDRIIEKYSRVSPASAVIAQAVGTAAVESWCDLFVSSIGTSLQKEPAYLRPRFSPGYGDFALSHQREICQLLDTSRKIGVSLTDSLLMTPTKSVTAVAGISETDERCAQTGCEACNKQKECLYARG
ncbi:MAG: Vitamin B12 dependent methionine synthase activation subunit [Clostridia bacterium]|nr:Vitamin B12 dependent methionine synthase activation subunit [Clostridia bacterium]